MRTGPSTVCAEIDASPSMRCTSGRRSWIDCARTIGMIDSDRVSTPRRMRRVASSPPVSASARPARRRPQSSTAPERRPPRTYPSAGPMSPSRSVSISSASSPVPGSSVSMTRSTSCSRPTGSTTFCVAF